MADFLREPISFFPTRPLRSIGGFTGHITLSEVGNDKLTVTKHPVQQGAQITDHSYIEPSELSVQIQAADYTKPLSEIYEDFLELQRLREPFFVVTGKRSYDNMLLTTIQQTTDKAKENVLALTLTFIEVILVPVTTTILQPRNKQQFPNETGATEKTGKKSALRTFSEGVTGFIGG